VGRRSAEVRTLHVLAKYLLAAAGMLVPGLQASGQVASSFVDFSVQVVGTDNKASPKDWRTDIKLSSREGFRLWYASEGAPALYVVYEDFQGVLQTLVPSDLGGPYAGGTQIPAGATALVPEGSGVDRIHLLVLPRQDAELDAALKALASLDAKAAASRRLPVQNRVLDRIGALRKLYSGVVQGGEKPGTLAGVVRSIPRASNSDPAQIFDFLRIEAGPGYVRTIRIYH